MITELKVNDIHYKFNNTQIQFLENLLNEDLSLKDNNYRQFSFFGGIRAGKSFICQLVIFLLCIKYPNLNVLYIRKYYHELEDTVIKQFCTDFGGHGLFKYIGSSKEGKRLAKFSNGSQIRFRALDQDGTAVLSSEYDIIAMCQAEEINEDVYLLALGRLSGKAIKKSIMLLEGNPASGWVKRTFKDVPKSQLEDKRMVFVEVDTKENQANLPEGYVDYLKSVYPEFWIRRYLYGEWANLDEMVFSEFLEKEHIVDPIDYKFLQNYKCSAGMDYGWVNPTAIVWGVIDYDGVLIIFDEWGGRQKTVPEIVEAGKRYGKLMIVADYSIKRPDRDGRSLWNDLKRNGLFLKESNKQEMQNIALANQLLKTGRIKITRNCVELLQEIQNYKWKKIRLTDEKNMPEQPVDKDNHYIDALLYLIASLEELKSINPEEIAFRGSLAGKTMYPSKDNLEYYS